MERKVKQKAEGGVISFKDNDVGKYCFQKEKHGRDSSYPVAALTSHVISVK